MGNVHLVTGYAGQQHVTSADQGSFNAAMVGSGQYVMQNGNQFAASVITNNLVKVLDGDVLMQGRHIRLNAGSYVELTIENGQQGYLRNDLIAIRYTKDAETGVEYANLVVIKGTAAESDPEDPTYTIGDIIGNGDIVNDMPLYRVPLDGLNVQELVPLFTAAETTPAKLLEKIENLTAADVGALPLTGGTLTGPVYFNNFDPIIGLPLDVSSAYRLRFYSGPGLDWGSGASMILLSKNATTDPGKAQITAHDGTKTKTFALYPDGTLTWGGKAIHGAHNKPTGTYTGNGSATARTIDTGGIGNLVFVRNNSNDMVCLAHPGGCFYYDAAENTVSGRSGLRFANGVITIDMTHECANANGVTYTYQVL